MNRNYQNTITNQGFTLIEVLLALSIVAIALTALLIASSQNVINTQRIKDKMIGHWVAKQGANQIQLGMVQVPRQQPITKSTHFLGQKWYWRAKLNPNNTSFMDHITITVSKKQDGPFSSPLNFFRYTK